MEGLLLVEYLFMELILFLKTNLIGIGLILREMEITITTQTGFIGILPIVIGQTWTIKPHILLDHLLILFLE